MVWAAVVGTRVHEENTWTLVDSKTSLVAAAAVIKIKMSSGMIMMIKSNHKRGKPALFSYLRKFGVSQPTPMSKSCGRLRNTAA